MTTRSEGGAHGGDSDARYKVTHGDETKPSWRSTELYVYAVVVIAVLIASQLVGDESGDGGNGHGDYFRADKAWWYITLLTIGYLISRGLAKAGSRSGSIDDRTG
jgi:hypothetical protein